MLTLLTVNYGEPQQLDALWGSLMEFPPPGEWEWVVVENGSAVEHAGWLTEWAQEKTPVRLIPLRENRGFGAGNNEGVRFARGEVLFLLNPDTRVTKTTWLVLSELEQPGVGMVFPQTFTEEGGWMQIARQPPTVSRLWRRRMGKGGLVENEHTHQEPRPIAWGHGCACALRTSLWNEIGGFDERFFLFFEDTDLCRRVWQRGQKVMLVPKAEIIHGKDRLSGTGLSVCRSTFWIHLYSYVKYEMKWKGAPWPRVE